MNETATLTATVQPLDATNRNVSWSSDNEGVATVDNGVVTAHSAGTANITVTTEEGGFEQSCVVTVKASQPQTIAVTSVTLDKSALTMKVGESFVLKATVKPDDATNKKVSWGSDKPTVAKVEDGRVTALAEGKANITVTTEDGKKTAACTVSVVKDGKKTPVEAALSHLSLFPNPAKSQLSIEGLEGAAEVQIVNALGRTLFSGIVQPGEPIDVSALPAGVYLLQVEGATMRFVKE